MPAGLEFVIHPDGDDFLYRPVIEGILPLEDILGEPPSLGDIQRLNEALDIRAENQRRLKAWHDANQKH